MHMRLTSLVTEITLDTAQPYATWFTWTSAGFGDDSWKTSFEADGQRIDVMLIGYQKALGLTYVMEYRVPSKTGTSTTYSHDRSAAQLDYFRLMTTMLEAIIDFCTQHAPAAIDISGADENPSRADQKTRIYAALLRSNSTRLAQAGYRVLQGDRKLEIVRDDISDASGIDTRDNSNM